MIDALLEVRGVRHAILVDAGNNVVTSAGLDALELREELSLITSARAVIGSLQQSLNTGQWQELLLDVQGGPVLLTPHGPQVLLVAFDEVASLGRVRFAVRRELGQSG